MKMQTVQPGQTYPTAARSQTSHSFTTSDHHTGPSSVNAILSYVVEDHASGSETRWIGHGSMILPVSVGEFSVSAALRRSSVLSSPMITEALTGCWPPGLHR